MIGTYEHDTLHYRSLQFQVLLHKALVFNPLGKIYMNRSEYTHHLCFKLTVEGAECQRLDVLDRFSIIGVAQVSRGDVCIERWRNSLLRFRR